MLLAVADNFLRVAAVPKLNYLCRVGTPGEYSRALAQFDARVQLTQSGMWRTQAPATSHERAPLRHSGIYSVYVEDFLCMLGFQGSLPFGQGTDPCGPWCLRKEQDEADAATRGQRHQDCIDVKNRRGLGRRRPP